MRRTCLVPLLLLGAACAAGAQGWEDTFADEALDPRWTWRVPAAGPVFSLDERAGWLRIRIPQRANAYNHWNEPRADDAPQLRAPAPEGDWELEAHVQLQASEAASHFHVGLVVGCSDAKLLTWGLLQGSGLPGGPRKPEVWLEPTGVSGYRKVPGEMTDVRLRLTRVGNEVRAALDGGVGGWRDAGTYTLAEPPRFLGLIGKTFSNGPAVAFDVDYVRLTPRGPGGAPERAAPAPPPPAPGEGKAAALATGPPGGEDPAGGGPAPAVGAAPGRAAAPSVPTVGTVVTPGTIALGRHLCDVAERCLQERRYADAEACYRVVLLYLPESPRARAGLARLRARR